MPGDRILHCLPDMSHEATKGFIFLLFFFLFFKSVSHFVHARAEFVMQVLEWGGGRFSGGRLRGVSLFVPAFLCFPPQKLGGKPPSPPLPTSLTCADLSSKSFELALSFPAESERIIFK